MPTSELWTLGVEKKKEKTIGTDDTSKKAKALIDKVQ